MRAGTAEARRSPGPSGGRSRRRLLPPWILALFALGMASLLWALFPRRAPVRLASLPLAPVASDSSDAGAWPPGRDTIPATAGPIGSDGHAWRCQAALAAVALADRRGDTSALVRAIASLWGQEPGPADLDDAACLAAKWGLYGPAIASLERAERFPGAAAGWERAAKQALARGDYRPAADLYFRAQGRGGDRALRRRLYLEALKCLQSGDLLAEALAQAGPHLGDLSDDREALEFLARLALAADRPAVAQEYCRRLLAAPRPMARGGR